MDLLTLSQAREALQGFVINESSYNFAPSSDPGAALLAEAKALRYRVETLAEKVKAYNEVAQ